MADKMMRIAARGEDGLAKALAANNNGELKVELPAPVIEKEEKSYNYYKQGEELIPFSQGYKSGNGTYKEDTDNITLSLSGNTGLAEIAVSSTTTVDVTNLQRLCLNFEMTGTAPYDSLAYFEIGKSSTSTFEYYERRVTITSKSGTPITRKTIEMDVSDLSGTYFIKVHLRDSSVEADVPATMKIHNIYGEEPLVMRMRTIGEFGAEMVDGTRTLLSAEKDTEGRAVLRVVDAAPHAYDPVNDRIETNFKTMEVLLEKDGNVTVPANSSLELMFSTPVDNYRKIIVIYRPVTPSENTNLKVAVENRLIDTGFVIFSEEKSGRSGLVGNTVDFDLTFPRVNVMLKNSSSNNIIIQRYAIVGVK